MIGFSSVSPRATASFWARARPSGDGGGIVAAAVAAGFSPDGGVLIAPHSSLLGKRLCPIRPEPHLPCSRPASRKTARRPADPLRRWLPRPGRSLQLPRLTHQRL